MEAVTEANRTTDDGVKQFIFPSSVSATGRICLRRPPKNRSLAAHTLPYAIHKKQSDEVVQQRSHALRGCSVYILRPHIFTGASVENYLMGAFRGTPNGKSARAEKMRSAGKRLPCMFPRGQQVPRQQDSVHPRGRHGATDPAHPAARTRNAAPDGAERRRPRRTADLRALRRDGSRETGSRPGKVDDAAGAEIPVEAEDFRDPSARPFLT